MSKKLTPTEHAGEARMTALKVGEHATQSAILDYLKVRGIFAWRQNSGAVKTEYRIRTGQVKRGFVRYGFAGMSDILGILPDGRFLAIEVKAADGTITREQREFLYRIDKNGGVAILARSLEQVMSELEGKI